MNTLSKYTFGSILLAGALLLPACGSKNSVKSETPGQNIVQPAQTPESMVEPYKETTVISDSGSTRPVHSYSKKSNDAQNETVAAAPAKPVVAAVTPAPAASPISAQPEKKSGSKWLWILAAVLALVGGGYYLYTKKSPRRKGHPLPPMGGLSPVSGFTAMKDKVQSAKPSFWTKKLF